MATNFRDLAKAEGRSVLDALQQGGKKLSPLGDPWRVILSDHRWLHYNREESYSDWLAWVTTTMRPEEILDIFWAWQRQGACAAAVCGQQVKVTREIVIGTSDALKRLDLVIRFGTVATPRWCTLQDLIRVAQWTHGKVPSPSEVRGVAVLIRKYPGGPATEVTSR
jgi:hypothetical protein